MVRTTVRGQEVKNVSEDTEITLGVGKMLGLFFVLVILCGAALGTGYWLGRNTLKPTVGAAAGSSAGQTSAAAASAGESAANQAAGSGGKPGAAQAAAPKTTDCPSGGNCPPQTSASPNPTDLTFYQAVQEKDPRPQLTPQETAASAAPQAAAGTHGTLGPGFMVQIAAVRNSDDAKLLGNTLQKQRYPVLITQPGDNLYHVQVGPFADTKEADAMRDRLVAAGYNNAFVKH